MLLTSKFFSEFDSEFCTHKVRMFQKGFSQLFFCLVCKMMSFTEIMKQPLERLD